MVRRSISITYAAALAACSCSPDSSFTSGTDEASGGNSPDALAPGGAGGSGTGGKGPGGTGVGGSAGAGGRAALPCLEPGRADLIVAGVAIVDATLDRWGQERLIVSDWSLREGLLAEVATREV